MLSHVCSLVFRESKTLAPFENPPALPRSLSLVPLPAKHLNLGAVKRSAATLEVGGKPIAGLGLLVWNERWFEAW